MVTQDLINYIKSSLASGADPETLKAELRGHGWATDDIDSALVAAQEGAAEPAETETSAWRMPQKELFIGIAGLLILGIAGAAAAFYFIPPKPEKVMQLAAASLVNVKSFDYSGNLVVDISAPSGLFSFDNLLHGFPAGSHDSRIAGSTETKFDVDFSGTADLNDTQNPKSDVKLNFNYSLFNFGMEMRLLDKIYYLKFNNLPKLSADEYDLRKYSNVWIKIDPSDISREYGLDISATSKQADLTEGQKKQIIELASSAHFFNSITKLPDDQIDGQDMYHYAVDIDTNGLKDYFREVERIQNSTKTLDSDLNRLSISGTEVWIGKHDKLIYKLLTKIAENPDPGTVNLPASGSVNISLALRNYNHPSPIIAPSSPRNILDVIKDLTGNILADTQAAPRGIGN